MAARIVGHLRVWYHALTREGGPAILDAFKRRSVPWWGEEVEVCFGGAVRRGIALGVDADGGLQLRRPDGSTVSVHSGEASALRRGSS
jgi:biotin-(acetyl-CoA carboxylase) ligase